MKNKIVVALLTTCVCASMLFGCGSTAAPAAQTDVEEPGTEVSAPADEKQEETPAADEADDDQADRKSVV